MRPDILTPWVSFNYGFPPFRLLSNKLRRLMRREMPIPSLFTLMTHDASMTPAYYTNRHFSAEQWS